MDGSRKVRASTRGRVLRGVEHIPRLPGVAVHLLDQGWQVGKLLFVAQLRDELDLDATTVQVAVKIEQVCLQQRFDAAHRGTGRSEEHTSELQSLMRTSYAVFCLKQKKT